MEYTGIIHRWKGGRSNMTYYGNYPLNPNLIRANKPSFPNSQYCVPPINQILPTNPTPRLGYWQLLYPALFGTAGALFLGFFTDDNLTEHCGETLFKAAITWYAIGATVAASFAVAEVLLNSKAYNDHLVSSIVVALIIIILFFASEYLLLYRFFPNSFKGDVGDNFWVQLFSFIYFSITTIATADLGDILPTNLTARVLIATEIAFDVFMLATGIQLLLARSN